MTYVSSIAPAILRARPDRGNYAVGQSYAKGDIVTNAGVRYMATLQQFYAQNFAAELAAGNFVLEPSVDASVVAANTAAINANTAADAARIAAEAAAGGAAAIGVAAAGGAPALIPAGNLQAALAAISGFINDRVLRTGDTMTGNLTVSATSATSGVVLNKAPVATAIYATTAAMYLGSSSAHPLHIYAGGQTKFSINTNGLLNHNATNTPVATYAALVDADPSALPNRQWIDNNKVAVGGDTMTGNLIIDTTAVTTSGVVFRKSGVTMSAYAQAGSALLTTSSNHPLMIGVNGQTQYTFAAGAAIRIDPTTLANYETLVTHDDDIPNRKFVTDYGVAKIGDTMTGLLANTVDGVAFQSTVGPDTAAIFNPSAAPGAVSIGSFSAGTNTSITAGAGQAMFTALTDGRLYQSTIGPVAYSGLVTSDATGRILLNRRYFMDKLNAFRAELIALGGVLAGLAPAQPT